MRPNKRFLMNCEKKIPSAVSLFHVYKTFLTEKKTCSVFPAIHSFCFILLIAYQSEQLIVFCLDLSLLVYFLRFCPHLKKDVFFCDFFKALQNLQAILQRTFFFVSSWQQCPKNICSEIFVPKVFKFLFLELPGNKILEEKYFFSKIFEVKKWLNSQYLKKTIISVDTQLTPPPPEGEICFWTFSF